MNRKEWKTLLETKNGTLYGKLVYIQVWSCVENNDMCNVVYVSKAGACRKISYTLDVNNDIIELDYRVLF